MNNFNVLVLESQEEYRNLLTNFLYEKECNVFSTGNIDKAMGILRDEEIDLVFVDISLNESGAVDLLRKIKFRDTLLTTVVIASNSDTDSVIDVFLSGADDILLKPFGKQQLQTILERSKPYIDFQKGKQIIDLNFQIACKQLKDKFNIEIAGASNSMKNVINMICLVAESVSTTVLITGESGTGKELVARGVHALSGRSRNFFHSVNCSAVPESLFESEFFGHKKGAFTGATDNNVGWFEIAQNGTLFLDEISEMPLNMQAKFLRVLEDKMISKVGAKKCISLDLRIIAATNQDLEKLVDKNAFRLDLYHRITPFVINIPPLRERKEDIPELINYYVNYFAKNLNKNITRVDENIYYKLQNYHFPGNVRELKNIIERAMILCKGNSLLSSDIKLKEKNNLEQGGLFFQKEFDLSKIEKKTILQALSVCESNKSRASQLLNISRQALDRKIQKYGIEIETS